MSDIQRMLVLQNAMTQKSKDLFVKTLGSGSFATVYGPFSKIQTLSLLQKMFQNDDTYWKSVRHIINNLLVSSHTYIFRFENLHFGKFTDAVSFNTETTNIIRHIPIRARPYFITPLMIGFSRSEIFEVQRYGGQELSKILFKSSKSFWTPSRLRQSLISWYHLFEGCLVILEKKDKMFTDIKPRNMVIDDTGNISIIDIERISVPRKVNQRIVFTINESLVPIQFINQVNFFDRVDEYRRKYLDKRTNHHQKKRDKEIIQNFPVFDTPEKIKTMCRFTLTWTFMHLLHNVLEKTDHRLASSFYNKHLQRLYTQRLTFDTYAFMKQIRVCIDRF